MFPVELDSIGICILGGMPTPVFGFKHGFAIKSTPKLEDSLGGATQKTVFSTMNLSDETAKVIQNSLHALKNLDLPLANHSLNGNSHVSNSD